MPELTLTPEEARVLGALMEKSVTTPDGYPLSLNSLMTACNQTTNRDPVVKYDDQVVERTLDSLREKGLARRLKSAGQRVIKFRHVAGETLALDPGELAVIGVLLLRGPQTPGELKIRTERWHAFGALEDVEKTLQNLVAREFVVHLPRRAGQKEARWAQLLCEVAESPTAYVAPVEVVQPGTAASAAPAAVPLEPKPSRTLDVHNPADGSLLRTIEVDDERAVATKLERARRAQRAWAARPYEERAAALRRFREMLIAEIETFAATTTAEVGKPLNQSSGEIRGAGDRVDWFIAHVPNVLEPVAVTVRDDLEERVSYEPVGVVAHVSAWNYPYFVGLNSIVPALLAGNAVLYKPSEHATLTGLALVDLMHRAGVPVDVVQAVPGAGPTGAALVEADVDLVCFTGSHATGSKVAMAAAARLSRVQLELGGKDPAYVCDDVDVDNTAMAVAEGVFYNAGQSCCAIERVYVHERIWQPFLDAFVAIAEAYRVGDPTDDATDIGPLAREEQVAVLETQVQDALGKGAKLLLGGKRIDRPGHWFEPTVLVNVDNHMAVMREESFGPVIGVQRVANDDEAVRLMDDTPYGLTAAVFSTDRERATHVLEALDTGSVYWNCSDRTSVCLPWAGRRRSGLGVSLGEAGIRAFVREKAWHLRPA
ncbi:MAG: aldehyde dehydrogenase [Actinomycetia bacterium]|nr:aldehyde dehydrogenase [Actinomycetes bacterium]